MLMDWIRAGTATTALFLVGLLSQVAGQQQQAQAVASQIERAEQGPAITGGTAVGADQVQVTVAQWAVREGGAFVVILVILFFYRRDWKTATEFWRDQHVITTQLVVAATKAQTETAAALRENTTVVHQTKHVMQKYLPHRRDGEDLT